MSGCILISTCGLFETKNSGTRDLLILSLAMLHPSLLRLPLNLSMKSFLLSLYHPRATDFT